MEDCDANIGYNNVQDGNGADMELDPMLDVIKTEFLDEENEDLKFSTVKYLKEPKRELKVKKRMRKQGIGRSLKNFKRKHRIQRLELEIMEAEGVQNGIRWSCNRCSDVSKDGPTFLDHLHKAHHILSPTIKKNQDERNADKKLQPYIVKREKNSWQCRMCDISCSCKSTFVNHLRKFHNIEISVLEYKCPHGDREFASDQSLTNHVKSLHADKDATAKDLISSGTLVDTERDLMIENGDQDDEGMWRCNKCDLRYNENIFVAHLKKFHRVGLLASFSHVCKYCNTRFTRMGNLNTHIRRMHPEVRATCSESVKGENAAGNTENTRNLRTLVNKANEIKTDMIKHDPEEALKEYGNQDEETKSWCCSICGTRFSIVSSLINHLKRTHNIKIASYDYKCSYCKMEFRNKNALRDHSVRIHFVCRARKKISGNKNKVTKNSVQESRELKKHGKRNQHGTWLCNHCSAMYDKKAAFIRHLESSHNVDVVDVKFDCPSCDKNYLTYMSLSRHLKNKHSSNDDEDEKKDLKKYGNKDESGFWLCSKCGFGYSSDNRFIHHLKKCHHIKAANFEYKCPHCELEFRKLVSLRVHVKSKHADNGANQKQSPKVKNTKKISGKMNKDMNTPVEGSETIVSVQNAVETFNETLEV